MMERFEGEDGMRRLHDALRSQRIVLGNDTIATEIVDVVALKSVDKDDVLIEQNAGDNSLYLILSGSFRIVVNGKPIGVRKAGNHVGEMAAVEPGQRRAASVVADEPSVVAELPEPAFSALANKYPSIWRLLAAELSRRLYERNKLINAPHEKIRLFVISSREALPIAYALEATFKGEEFETKLWTDDVFKISSYTLEDLEREIDAADFAVAIAEPDDHTKSRGKGWPSPRDNVIFELGLFMGHLGRRRAILMEPRDEGVKLPSDLAGVKTVPYAPIRHWRFKKLTLIGRIFGWKHSDEDIVRAIAGACEQLKRHIYQQGMRE